MYHCIRHSRNFGVIVGVSGGVRACILPVSIDRESAGGLRTVRVGEEIECWI